MNKKMYIQFPKLYDTHFCKSGDVVNIYYNFFIFVYGINNIKFRNMK